ncbi:MAG: hypothetical protein BGO78_12670 [Chloroflexi bacterium 44-23]|nr:MAG: hypothetical protein BGO78_12670 [Chloroflexi bacterium 44-23]
MQKMLTLLFAIFIIALSGCTEKTTNIEPESQSSIISVQMADMEKQISVYEIKINELNENLHTNEIELNYLKEERDSYRKFIDQSIEYFSEDELMVLAKSEFSYVIEVNGLAVPPSAEVEVKSGDVTITLIERVTAFPALPLYIHEKGFISGNAWEHLHFQDEADSVTGTDGTVVVSYIYNYSDIQNGSVIKVEITNELQERLQLDSNVITINVK